MICVITHVKMSKTNIPYIQLDTPLGYGYIPLKGNRLITKVIKRLLDFKSTEFCEDDPSIVGRRFNCLVESSISGFQDKVFSIVDIKHIFEED